MKLRWLKEILGGRFVSRQDFNDKNTKFKEAEIQVAQLTCSCPLWQKRKVDKHNI